MSTSGAIQNDTVAVQKIIHILEGDTTLSAHKLKRIVEEETFRLDHNISFETLTPREREVLRLIALGETNQQIAEKLFVSCDTVRTHRNRIWQKLEIKNLVGAIRFAQAFDLI